jgi:hypothetical protein
MGSFLLSVSRPRVTLQALLGAAGSPLRLIAGQRGERRRRDALTGAWVVRPWHWELCE